MISADRSREAPFLDYLAFAVSRPPGFNVATSRRRVPKQEPRTRTGEPVSPAAALQPSAQLLDRLGIVPMPSTAPAITKSGEMHKRWLRRSSPTVGTVRHRQQSYSAQCVSREFRDVGVTVNGHEKVGFGQQRTQNMYDSVHAT